MIRRIIDSSDLETISPLFRGKKRSWLRAIGVRLFAIEKVNDLYERSCEYVGAEFAEHILDDLGVEYLIGHPDHLDNLPEGAFITISNHPYGGIDGIMLIDLLAHKRPDFKVMVNQFLSKVEALKDHFIFVVPKMGRKSPDPKLVMKSIRETLLRLKKGHPVGLFPAGAVSMFQFHTMRVRDRKWQEGVLKIIKHANVPILPIRFYNGNSILFYFLGIIDWRIRTIRMPFELFNKYHRPHRIGIGQMILPEKLKEFTDMRSLNKYLRSSVYDIPKPTSWCTRKTFKSNQGL